MSGEPDQPPASPIHNGAMWARLRQITEARIGLQRSGASLATRPLLEFKLAHARARDAVQAELDDAKLAATLGGFGLPVLTLASAAPDKKTYLMRPDLGRRLHPDAAATIAPYAGAYSLAIVVSDGLSAGAVQMHAAPVIAAAIKLLQPEDWRIAPLTIARYGRVALGDAIANMIGADCVAVLIGERPGLSAPDSMGCYITWRPTANTTDADRNCISNIRPNGVGYVDAAFKLAYLAQSIRARRLSGVLLKDKSTQLTFDGAPPKPA